MIRPVSGLATSQVVVHRVVFVSQYPLIASLGGRAGASSGGSKAPGVVEGDALYDVYASLAQHHRTATTTRYTRCDGSLPSPLHLAIIRNEFLMMFPPMAMWTRAVGLRGLTLLLKNNPDDKFHLNSYLLISQITIIINLLIIIIFNKPED